MEHFTDLWACDDLKVQVGNFQVNVEACPTRLAWIELAFIDKNGGRCNPCLYAEDLRSLLKCLEGWTGKG